jgi:hypothetical protein
MGKYDITEFLKEGKEKEVMFADLFSSYSLSDKNTDIIKHYDLTIGNIRIDVKGLKKVNRWDNEVNENIHWIEIKGITGHLGWLYGEADYFAFETFDYWILVCKDKLQDLIKTRTIKEWVKEKELYKLYQRPNKKDVITLVKTIDLCSISEAIIGKKNINN